jgi:peptidoglycan/LPS O-acetylase OafA/YrhL
VGEKVSAETEGVDLGQPRAFKGEPKPHMMLGDALRGHNNSLGLIRLVLASLVIVDHAFPLGGFGVEPVAGWTIGQTSLGGIAVAGFFAISGYLIAKSALAADILQFLWRRFLRIFPAYWAVLILTAFVIAPILWWAEGQNLVQYFRSNPEGPFTYLKVNWTLRVGTYGIYDLLASTTPYGRAVGGSVFNGSLWTLTYEWMCYLLVGICLVFGVLRRAKIVVPILTAFLALAQFVQLFAPKQVGLIAPYLWDRELTFLLLAFAFGACLALYAKAIPFDDRLGILAGLVLALSLRFGGYAIVGMAAGAYFVLYVAVRLPAVFRKVGTRNDYSYGVYIYGFLVQQLLSWLGVNRWGYFPYVLISLVFSFAFAWLSWHGIEKHAMSLKDSGPGRGIPHWRDRIGNLLPGRNQKIRKAA